MPHLNSNNREVLIRRALAEEFDLIVIGGGITGAGIALEAGVRGISTLLIEKKDFAFGTSSRSTKLVHGGLRYLKNMEFGLVRELGIERAVVHKIAPHLTIPEKMLTPIVKGGTYGKWLTSIGIAVYDYLAGVKKEERRKMLSTDETKNQEPLIRKDILKGAALYYEYRTDDARLTMEIIKTASRKKAVCLNYVECKDFIMEQDRITGVECVDHLKDTLLRFKAKVVINATGPWVDTVRVKSENIKGKKLHLTKGIHLVVPHELLPVKQAIYFDVFDGRMIFVIPRGEITYFGTTDTNYSGDKDHPTITNDDVTYLLAAVNNMFPGVNLKEKHIISGWAGLRPLIHEEGKKTFEISRKDEIFISEKGLVSIAGGKLTGYRKMAEKVVNKIMPLLKAKGLNNFLSGDTAEVILSGGEFSNEEALKTKIADVHNFLSKYIPSSAKLASRLIHMYGMQVEEILYYFEFYSSQLEPVKALLKAELKFCVEREAVYKLDDFVVRRTGFLYFQPDIIKNYLDDLGIWLKELIGKEDSQMEKEKQELLQLLREVSTFENN